jgi:hypothetical protein
MMSFVGVATNGVADIGRGSFDADVISMTSLVHDIAWWRDSIRGDRLRYSLLLGKSWGKLKRRL